MRIDFFKGNSLFTATSQLFEQLGLRLNSNTSQPLDYEEILKQHARDTSAFLAIEKTYFAGLIDDSVFQQLAFFKQEYDVQEALIEADKNYEGLMLFALELNKKPTRAEISDLTRAFNRISQKMPVALLLQYYCDDILYISIAISERFKYKQSWRHGEKTGKIIMLRDINTINPHSGHLRILRDLVKPVGITTFSQLHDQWLDVLDVSILNKKFFNDLANWYLYSQDFVKFPNDRKIEEHKHIQINLIRLITRLIFVWFLKEKGLIEEALFEPAQINKWLKQFNPNGENTKSYYHAILQNLFFATLNQRMDERDFIREGSFSENKEQYGVKTLYRYASSFNISEKEVKKIFGNIPFLNGGLFDCLDKEDEETGKVIYVDGFSRNSKKAPSVPDFLFFGTERIVDLTNKYGFRKTKERFCGIIEIFKSYKFTIEENTPIEEEIALDPELLGKVFENLLAYYNPETETTARKQTGSFYTPREIVNYMVDESLIAYLRKEMLTINPAYLEFGRNQTELFANEAKKGQLSFVENLNQNRWQKRENELEDQLRRLVSYNNERPSFTEEEIQRLIFAIDNCKIIDPACGSGAFPMGILHKLVHMLSKLDPENKRWRQLQQKKAEIEIHNALTEKDKKQREKKLIEINDAFEHNSSDYGRKLYLIENSIYGVDVQAIAVQISKLRFFISLIVDQKERGNADNRGIRPLPNLETKFVAANTLVGLTTPEGLNFRSERMIQLEEELKNNRHKHFSAPTWREKKQFQLKDREIRKEIAELIKKEYRQYEKDIITKITQLKNQLLLTEKSPVKPHLKLKQEKAIKELHNKIDKLQAGLVDEAIVDDAATKISKFDIYDQNTSANWFDPEWMFGKDVYNGFDIVIGNPPYVDIKGLPKDDVRLFFNTFKTAEKRINLYALFIEKGLKLLNSEGVLVYINPNSLLVNESYKKIRQLLVDGVEKLVKLPDAVFEAIVETMILISKKKSPNFDIQGLYFSKDDEIDFSDLRFHSFDRNAWKSDPETRFGIFLNDNITSLLNQFSESTKPLEHFVYTSLGITPYDKYKGHSEELISSKKFHAKSKLSEKYVPLISGKNIHHFYISNETDEYLKYGDWLGAPREKRFFEHPKIIVRQILEGAHLKIVAGYSESPHYFTQIGFSLISKTEDSNKLKYLLCLLNSNLLTFYHKHKFLDKEKYVFQKILIANCRKLPVKESSYQDIFVKVADILLRISDSSNPMFIFFERVVNAMVYETYLPDKIKSANCEVLNHLANLPRMKDINSHKLSLKEIEKLYQDISSTSNSISSALLKLINIEEIIIIEDRK